LSRDELQGVVAHEFSHILNGDMRLNLRLLCFLNGLVAIHLTGASLLHFVFDRDDPVMGLTLARGFASSIFGIAILFLGFALIGIGYVGAVAARLIQAGVSRQREFLADAAAVQFTRNQSGIAGALTKIGGHSLHGTIRDAHAQESSHMFIVEAVSYAHSLFDSHPPLVNRIQRLDPSFTGEFPVVGVDQHKDGRRKEAAPRRNDPVWLPPPRRESLDLITAQVGMAALQASQLERARRILKGIPQNLREAVQEPAAAEAVLLFLLSWDRPQVLEAVNRGPAAVTEAIDRLLPDLVRLAPDAALPLVEILLPTLHWLSVEQYQALRLQMEDAIDEGLSLSGLCLRQVVIHHLDRHFGIRPRRPRRAIHSLDDVKEKVSTMIGALSHAGPKDSDRAWRAAKVALPLSWQSVPLPPVHRCGGQMLPEALRVLPSLSLGLKRTLMEAAVFCVGSDQRVASEEADLLHMLAAVLGLPAPAILGLSVDDYVSGVTATAHSELATHTEADKV